MDKKTLYAAIGGGIAALTGVAVGVAVLLKKHAQEEETVDLEIIEEEPIEEAVEAEEAAAEVEEVAAEVEEAAAKVEEAAAEVEEAATEVEEKND